MARIRLPRFSLRRPGASGRASRRSRYVWSALVLVLAGVLVWQATEMRADRRDDALRAEVRDVATAQVLDLTTLDSSTVDQKLAAMAGRTAGEFTDQIGTITSTFSDLVRTNDIAASGVVDAAAVSRLSATDATVIVASTATVSEAGGEPSQRTYRLRITMEQRDDDWKITGMEFVQ